MATRKPTGNGVETSRLNENLERMLRLLKADSDDIPEGWWSRADFQKVTGQSESLASRTITRWGRLGMLETKRFKRKTFVNAGMVPHYRLKDGL